MTMKGGIGAVFSFTRRALLRLAPMLALAALALPGCAALSNLSPVSTQHPSWAMNPTTCAEVGAAVPQLLGLIPGFGAVATGSSSAIDGVILAVAGCQAEASLVNGPSAQTVTTTTQSQTVQAPVAAPTPAAVATPAPAAS